MGDFGPQGYVAGFNRLIPLPSDKTLKCSTRLDETNKVVTHTIFKNKETQDIANFLINEAIGLHSFNYTMKVTNRTIKFSEPYTSVYGACDESATKFAMFIITTDYMLCLKNGTPTSTDVKGILGRAKKRGG